MKLYSVKGWDSLYENNRTREMKQMLWIPVPNKHDGDGYTNLVSRKNGAALLGAWLVILQVASRCGKRGTLLRSTSQPHDAESISRITRLPKEIIQEALVICSTELDWLESQDVKEIPHLPAEKPHLPAGIPHPTDEEEKRREGMETNRIEKASPHVSRERFKIPTDEELNLHSQKIGLPSSEVQRFRNYYESNGWRVGKNPMKSWTHALTNWKLNWETNRKRENHANNDNRFIVGDQPVSKAERVLAERAAREKAERQAAEDRLAAKMDGSGSDSPGHPDNGHVNGALRI